MLARWHVPRYLRYGGSTLPYLMVVDSIVGGVCKDFRPLVAVGFEADEWVD